ncbi:unnamed protein product [Clavelina lepadiformis]|uniref:Transmembrane protein 106B n=1 Tax=Clavelina lepadiformis TaxID=159417 RepID=A0ABP0EV85_CLALP
MQGEPMGNGSLVTAHEPATNGIRSNYGTIGDQPETPGLDDFGYVEFSGKDGRTCPTCHGTGRIAKHHEDELVALIPYNDNRLKPSKTKYYVLLAVVVCLVACGLTLFFLLPRAVNIEEDRILNYTVYLDQNLSTTTIIIENRFNISNGNFFNIEVSDITVEAFFDQVSVGTGKISKQLSIPSRQSQYPVDVTIKTSYNPDNQLEFVVNLCSNPKRKVHDIFIKFQATQTVWYLQHMEQSSMTSYKYLDCSLNNVVVSG